MFTILGHSNICQAKLVLLHPHVKTFMFTMENTTTIVKKLVLNVQHRGTVKI